MKTERTLAEKPKGERPKQPACPSSEIKSDGTRGPRAEKQGCLVFFAGASILYLALILPLVMKDGNTIFRHHVRAFLLAPVSWPGMIGGYFRNPAFANSAVIAGYLLVAMSVLFMWQADNARSFWRAALCFILLFACSLGGCFVAGLNSFNAGFN